MGGNLINYPDEVSSPTADMSVVKLLWNSILSTPGSKFCTMDISNFYLGTKMTRPEFMMLPINIIPLPIQQQYNLLKLQHNNKVYCRITKGMYGLPQAGLLANNQLKETLATDGYYPCKQTTGLWKHKWRPIAFTLVVDDFGVKYTGKEHADHLYKSLQNAYKKVTIDWEGTLYCGITLQWDYTYRCLDISMTGYITNLLHKFQHPNPKKRQLSP